MGGITQVRGPHNNKYAIHYDFSDLGQYSVTSNDAENQANHEIDTDIAVKQFVDLCHDLTQVGLQIQVRAGDSQSLLVFVEAPKELLKSYVYNSRVNDWLYGITNTHPEVGGIGQGIDGVSEAEDLLSMYHLVHWPNDNGGAAITPGYGKWEHVKSIFPIHNDQANTALLGHLSKRIFLSHEDLDRIRDLFGVKVAFYFAYMQTYLLFLSFPALTGIYAWLFLPKYSLIYAIVTLLGCTVFLEYWKIQQADLSIRWNVRGIGQVKVNRATFQYEKIITDATGRTRYYFPKWKAIARHFLQIPFFAAALLILGVVITMVFAIEVLISEVYEGAYKQYLEYLPTIILAAGLPYMNSFLEDTATSLAEYENHRTQDHHEMSLNQKLFVLSFIANYLPIFLTAFVYVPFGDAIVPYLEGLLRQSLGPRVSQTLGHSSFHRDPDRLRNEVIALTVTGQLSDMFEELVLPYAMHRLRSWYRTYQTFRLNQSSERLSPDDPDEKVFLQNVRRQASLPGYNVQDDISEMVIQFGYLALFSPVWPLVSIGFLVNNWIELRSDFLKICIEHQRPHPVRADGIGPWVGCLDTLTLLGSISTGAIVHLFGTRLAGSERVSGSLLGQLSTGLSWWSLPVTIFVSEHIFLVLRSAVRFLLLRIGSDQVRYERNERFTRRKKRWDSLTSATEAVEASRPKSEQYSETEPGQDIRTEAKQMNEIGINLIRALKQTTAARATKKRD